MSMSISTHSNFGMNKANFAQKQHSHHSTNQANLSCGRKVTQMSSHHSASKKPLKKIDWSGTGSITIGSGGTTVQIGGQIKF